MNNLDKLTLCIKLIGFIKTLIYIFFCKFKITYIFKGKFCNKVFYFRSSSTDLETIYGNIHEEFNKLKNYIFCNEGDIIIDAGAYIGSSSIILSIIFPNAKIICLEPSKENFSLLKKNLKGKKNFVLINKALTIPSSKKKISFLFDKTNQWGGSLLNKDFKEKKITRYNVYSISLKQIYLKYKLNKKNLKIIKLDIEGYEKILFEKEKKNLNYFKLIFVELHDNIIKGCKYSFLSFSRYRKVKKLKGEKFISVKL